LYEETIASATIGEGLALRKFLGFQRDYAHLGQLAQFLQEQPGLLTSSLSLSNRSVLSNLFAMYRVVDIAATLKGLPELDLKYEKTRVVDTKLQVRTVLFSIFQQLLNLFQLFDRLEDWPPLLTNFRPSSTMLSAEANSLQPASLTKHVAVLKNLIACRGVLSSLINVQMAVISLHRMLNNVSALMLIGLLYTN
jgi:hypothetical protein